MCAGGREISVWGTSHSLVRLNSSHGLVEGSRVCGSPRRCISGRRSPASHWCRCAKSSNHVLGLYVFVSGDFAIIRNAGRSAYGLPDGCRSRLDGARISQEMSQYGASWQRWEPCARACGLRQPTLAFPLLDKSAEERIEPASAGAHTEGRRPASLREIRTGIATAA